MKPVAGVGTRGGDEMLAAAEADLQADLRDRRPERAQPANAAAALARSTTSAAEERRHQARPAAADSGLPLRRP